MMFCNFYLNSKQFLKQFICMHLVSMLMDAFVCKSMSVCSITSVFGKVMLRSIIHLCHV